MTLTEEAPAPGAPARDPHGRLMAQGGHRSNRLPATMYVTAAEPTVSTC